MVRRKIAFGTAALALLLVGRVASAQTAEEIVEKNLKRRAD